MTKVIYINWNDHVVVASAEDKEQWLDDWIESYRCIDDFEDWVNDNYSSIECFEMTDEDKKIVPLRYEKYVQEMKAHFRKEAEEYFNGWFETVGIEVDADDK